MSEIVFEDEYLSDREIIAFVQSNPLLWQKRIKIDKKNKDTIDQAFLQIGFLLSKPLTGDAVSTRWKSLRDQYSREMRKVIASQPRSGAGSEELSYKSTWPLFNELSFLKDVIKPRKTQSNVSRKKLKLSENTKTSNSFFNIVIPSSIMRISKNTEAIILRDSQVIQESEESQIVEENQVRRKRSNRRKQ